MIPASLDAKLRLGTSLSYHKLDKISVQISQVTLIEKLPIIIVSRFSKNMFSHAFIAYFSQNRKIPLIFYKNR